MSNTKFESNVTHNGVLFKSGDVVEGLEAEVQASLVSRGLAEETTDTPTHKLSEGDSSGRALPLDPVSTPSEPTAEEIAAETAKQTAAIQAQEAAAEKAAAEQTAAAQRVQDGGQVQQTMPGDKVPSNAEVAATAAQIQ